MAIKPRQALGDTSNLLGVGQWLWGLIKPYVVPAVGAGALTYQAAITKWIAVWGPIAWGTIGMISFLVLYWTMAIGSSLTAKARLRRLQAKVAEKTMDTAIVNPLSVRFFEQRIALHDLRTPAGEPVSNRVFDTCELVGPATFVIAGTKEKPLRLTGSTFHGCEFAKIQSNVRHSPNKIVFLSCEFTRCTFYNAIILVPDGDILRGVLEADWGKDGGVQWIT